MAVVIGTTYKPFVLGAMFGDNRTSNFPTPLYVALVTALPTVGGITGEPTDGAYARQPIANTSSGTGSARGFTISGGTFSNYNILQWGTATVNWGTIGFYAIMDAITGGNVVIGDALQSTLAVSPGMAPYISAGQLVIQD
jgi:hypothetical protein